MAFRDYRIKLTTAPATEPVDLTTAKLHCRVTSSAQDALITQIIQAAREQVEYDTGLSLMSQTLTMYLDEFPEDLIELTQGPVQSVTSVKYYDAANTLQTLSSATYQLDAVSNPGRLIPVSGSSWPTTYDKKNAVEILYVTGWTSAALIPAKYKQAMLLLIYSWFQNPSQVVTGTIVTELPMGYKALVSDNVRGI